MRKNNKIDDSLAQAMEGVMKDESYLQVFAKPVIKTASAKSEPQEIFESLLVISEKLDSFGFEKSAAMVLLAAEKMAKKDKDEDEDEEDEKDEHSNSYRTHSSKHTRNMMKDDEDDVNDAALPANPSELTPLQQLQLGPEALRQNIDSGRAGAYEVSTIPGASYSDMTKRIRPPSTPAAGAAGAATAAPPATKSDPLDNVMKRQQAMRARMFPGKPEIDPAVFAALSQQEKDKYLASLAPKQEQMLQSVTKAPPSWQGAAGYGTRGAGSLGSPPQPDAAQAARKAWEGEQEKASKEQAEQVRKSMEEALSSSKGVSSDEAAKALGFK